MIKNFFSVVGFTVNQGLCRILDLLSAIVIIRWFSISEFALYTCLSLIYTLSSISSDLSIGQGVTTLGAKSRNNLTELSRLYKAALSYSRIFFWCSAPIVLFIGYCTTSSLKESALKITFCFIIIFLSNWFQRATSLRNSIFNIHHDTQSINKITFVDSALRMCLTIALCKHFPYVLLALSIRLISTVVNYFISFYYAKKYINEKMPYESQQKNALKNFILPQIPSTIYFMFSGYISIFLLSLIGQKSFIAQIGALSRLGQIIGLFGTLNPVFLQPYLARVTNKKEFIQKSLGILIPTSILTILIFCTTFTHPKLWLFILGANYNNLHLELPLAIGTALLSYIGGTLYFIVISQYSSNIQSLRIVLGILSTLLYGYFIGIKSAFDALTLNLLIETSNFIPQIIIFFRLLIFWKERKDR